MPDLDSVPDLRRRPCAGAIIAASSRVAWADLHAIYTPLTWTVGWLGRIVMQVVFYALIGTLLGSRQTFVFLFVGQAVMACVMEVFMSVASTTWERGAGTLPLLTAAPGSLWPVFVGRSLQWLPSGTATACVALFVIGPFLGVGWSMPAAAVAAAAVLLTGASMYPVALTIASYALRRPGWRNMLSSVASTLTMLICGITVPLDFWPTWVRTLADAFPITHGVDAVRSLQGGTIYGSALSQLGWTTLSGIAWFAVAIGAFSLFDAAGRRDGSIEFSD